MDKKKLQTDILEKTYQPDKWLEVLTQYFGAKKFHQTPRQITLPVNDLAEKAVELGSFYTADERLIGIYEVNLTNKAWINKNRVGLRNLLRQVYKYDVDGALIVFVQDEKWRFSYVSEIRTEEGKKETEPKRYTYLFGNGESCRTAADRFDKLKDKPIYLNDLFDAFSVEKLNKEFFKSYKEYFEIFSDYLAKQIGYRQLLLGTSAELEKGWKDEKAKPIRNFSKRLLGRIVFLQFLQKKGWMGVPATTEDWTNGDPKFLQNLFLTCNDKAHFHSVALRSLFFETLNCKRTNHLAPAVIGENIKIPYLNGGLFDKDISLENDIDFPIDLFKNLLDFFEQYNFTIDENDPYDSEVGIDPEMLGHIFENLLEENREKGAFYTPKEIVHYMCHESLIQYLRTHLPECTEDDSPATKALENFIRNGVTGDRNDKRNFIVQQAKRIEKLLDTVKICDPAIGSGAFPMGMLQEIFNAKTALDLTLDHAEVKRQIIQNNIYGVDLEPGAVDIARLRFWLALVVDETEPQPLPNLDYKIMQGNSLLEQFEDISLKFERKVFEVKIVKQVDLFGRVVNPQYTINEYLQTKQHTKEFDITELEEKYFLSNIAEEKQQIREKIENFERQFILEQLNEREKQLNEILQLKENDFTIDISKVSESNAVYLRKGKKAKDIEIQKAELEKVRQYRDRLNQIKPGEKPWFLWHLYFMDVFDKGGFDIVIGNPPYIQMQKDAGYLSQMLENSNFQTFERTGDIYSLFYENGFNQLKNKGIITFISSNKWMRTNYGKSTRRFFNEKTNPLKLIDFGNVQIFESATVDTNILMLQKALQQKKFKACRFNETYVKGSALETYISKNTRFISFKSDDAWVIAESADVEIIEKVRNQGIPLEKWNITINYGIKTGLNDAFVIDSEIKDLLISKDSKSASVLKPLLRGKDIRKWIPIYSNLWLIGTFPSLNLNIDNFKAIKEYLFEFGKEKLVQDGTGRKKTGNEWFETQDQIAYWKDFEKPKIIYPNMTKYLPFVYDENEHYYHNDKSFHIVGEDLKWLVAFLNSALFKFTFSDDFPELQGGTRELRKVFFEKVPVKKVTENEQKPIELLVNKILAAKKDKSDTLRWENKIDALVFHYYGLTEDEMLQVLDSFKDMSIKDRNQIQNEYWNIANNKFQLEA